MRRTFDLPLAVALLAATACRPEPPAGARLEARWTGADTGRLAGHATARWCAPARYLELRGTQGDTGIGLALYPSDSPAAGRYPVLAPAAAESTRPRAAVALRRFGARAVEGFQGESGGVTLEAVRGGRVSGRLTAAARESNGARRLTITGTFRDVEVGPADPGCAGPDTTARRDSARDRAGVDEGGAGEGGADDNEAGD